MDKSFITFLIVICVLLILISLAVISMINVYVKYKNVFNPAKELSLLTWSKESGFNRAPTLAEAKMFSVDETGDLHRSTYGDDGHKNYP